MYRIDSAGHVANKFFDGDATGPESKPGTVLPAEWLNELQESLCHVIESQGLSPSKGQVEQLLVAIQKIATLQAEKLCRPLETELDKLRQAHTALAANVGFKG